MLIVLFFERPRKYDDKAEVRMRNEDGIAEYDVTVVKAEYDSSKNTWMYTLTDCDGQAVAATVSENMLV